MFFRDVRRRRRRRRPGRANIGRTFRQEVQESGIWNSHEYSQAEWEGTNWPRDIRQTLGSGT